MKKKTNALVMKVMKNPIPAPTPQKLMSAMTYALVVIIAHTNALWISK